MSTSDSAFSSVQDSDYTNSSEENSSVSLDGKVVKSYEFQYTWLFFGICAIFLLAFLITCCSFGAVIVLRTSYEHSYHVDGYSLANDQSFSLTLDSIPEFSSHNDNSFQFDGENVLYIQKFQSDDESDKFKCSSECIYDSPSSDFERRTAAAAVKPLVYSAFLTVTVFAASLFHATQNSRTTLEEMCSEVSTHVSSIHRVDEGSHDFQVQGLDCEADEQGRYMGHEYNSMHLCKGYCHKEGSERDELLCYEKIGSKTINRALEDITPLLNELCVGQLGKGYEARNIKCWSAMSVYIAGKCEELPDS